MNMPKGIRIALLCATAAFFLSALPGLAQVELNRTPQFVPGRYILFLQDEAVSARFTREEFETTAAVAYRQQVRAGQQALIQTLQSRNISVTGSIDTVLNAVFVATTADREAELASLPGVVAVRRERQGEKHLNKAVQLMNAPAAWSNTAIGGQGNAGKGIKIAILDTGIDQTHPAFQDSSLTVPSGFSNNTL